MRASVGLLAAMLLSAMSIELQEEEEWFQVTACPYPVKDFSQLLSSLKELDLSISRVLSSTSPDKMEGEKLILDLQGYVMSLGPLIRVMAEDDAEVLLVAKNVYRQGAPNLISKKINSDLLQTTFGWDENQMTLLHTLHSMCKKTWRNFLNMCERHRVEG